MVPWSLLKAVHGTLVPSPLVPSTVHGTLVPYLGPFHGTLVSFTWYLGLLHGTLVSVFLKAVHGTLVSVLELSDAAELRRRFLTWQVNRANRLIFGIHSASSA
jgi:hypothetical protein